MKIHADKVDGGPLHNLSVRDVKLILKTVPAGWIEGLQEVRLANSLEHYAPYAFLSRYDGCLTIYSRCGTKRQSVEAVLSALAVEALGINRGFRRHQAAGERKRMDKIVQPVLEKLLVSQMFQKKFPKKLSPEAHTPLEFAPFPNDVV